MLDSVTKGADGRGEVVQDLYQTLVIARLEDIREKVNEDLI